MKDMKPIHYSKLKVGDLIYVVTNNPSIYQSVFGKDEFLAEVEFNKYNLAMNVGKIGKWFESYVICDVANCEDTFFLIERGYFL